VWMWDTIGISETESQSTETLFNLANLTTLLSLLHHVKFLSGS
jgi:hypothetical protein